MDDMVERVWARCMACGRWGAMRPQARMCSRCYAQRRRQRREARRQLAAGTRWKEQLLQLVEGA